MDKITENYNRKFKKMKKYLNLKESYNISFENDKMTILNENQEKIIVGTYDFYGIIDKNNIFYWADLVPGVDKRISEKVKKIRKKHKNKYKEKFLNQLLSHKRIKITDDKKDLINKFLLYLDNNVFFFPQWNSNNQMQLIFLKDIKEIYV
jgi:hypothetical protein